MRDILSEPTVIWYILYCISGSVDTNKVRNTVIVTNMYTILVTCNFLTAELILLFKQVCHSGLTGLETS